MARVTIALALAALLSACASTPQVKTVYVPQEPVYVPRPTLAIEHLDPSASAAQVFQAYESSLLTCIGYAKQLEAAQRITPQQ